MPFCSSCGTPVYGSGRFCSACGTLQTLLPSPQPVYPPLPSSINPHHVAARGFAQIFGLHPAVAFLTLMVDTMLFGGDVVTLGTSLPLDITAAGILGFIAYKAQRKWYGDDKESAVIKALTLALLTSIPTNIPAFLYVPAGILGFFRRKNG
jgi:hypothetical protein